MSRTIKQSRLVHPYGHVALKGGMTINARDANLWCRCCRPNGNQRNGREQDRERRRVKRAMRYQWKKEADLL